MSRGYPAPNRVGIVGGWLLSMETSAFTVPSPIKAWIKEQVPVAGRCLLNTADAEHEVVARTCCGKAASGYQAQAPPRPTLHMKMNCWLHVTGVQPHAYWKEALLLALTQNSRGLTPAGRGTCSLADPAVDQWS